MSTNVHGAKYNMRARYSKTPPPKSTIDNYNLCSDNGANLGDSNSGNNAINEGTEIKIFVST